MNWRSCRIADSSPRRARLTSLSIAALSSGICRTGAGRFVSDTSFPPLAAGVLVIAGRVQCVLGEQGAERIEQEQFGLEGPHFVGDQGALAALAVEQLAAGAVDDGGRVTFSAAADVHADDAAIDAPGARVIAATFFAGFPGHGDEASDVRRTKWARHVTCAGKRQRRTSKSLFAKGGLTEFSEHAVDHGGSDHGLAHLRFGFVVTDQAAVFHEPPERPLDHPAAGQDDEAFLPLGLEDRPYQPAAGLLGPVDQRPGVPAVGPDHPQTREAALGRQQQILGPITVLLARRGDDHGQQQPQHVNQHMPLAAVDFFSPRRTPGCPDGRRT